MRSLVLAQVVRYCVYVMPKQKITVHDKQLPNLLDNMAATSLHLLLPKSHLTKLQKPHQNLHKDLQMPVKRFCSIDLVTQSNLTDDVLISAFERPQASMLRFLLRFFEVTPIKSIDGFDIRPPGATTLM